MSVPETSVNEYDFLPLGKHDIRLARQVTRVQPEAITHAVQQRAHEQFRLRIRAANAAHVPTAVFLCQAIFIHSQKLRKNQTDFTDRIHS